MGKQSAVFEKNYRDYLAQIAGLNVNWVAEKLGARMVSDEIIIPFFGKPHRVSAKGIVAPDNTRPVYSVCMVLCKYVLLCPDISPRDSDWVSYKDFQNAASFVGGFMNNAEKPLAENFSGRLQALKKACKDLGGSPSEIDLSYDLKMIFHPLPKVPLFLLFNDADEEFPAQSTLLFERRAEKYLDMECLAVLGWLLTDYLQQAGGVKAMTVM